jgi:hypothetical protein
MIWWVSECRKRGAFCRSYDLGAYDHSWEKLTFTALKPSWSEFYSSNYPTDLSNPAASTVRPKPQVRFQKPLGLLQLTATRLGIIPPPISA